MATKMLFMAAMSNAAGDGAGTALYRGVSLSYWPTLCFYPSATKCPVLSEVVAMQCG